MQTRSTGLCEVKEILAGETVEHDGYNITQYCAWDPRQLVKQKTVADYKEGKELLGSATQYCIDAWASVYRNISLQLSGGLDSAIVLGSLLRSPHRPQLTCIHSFSHDPQDDERRYARAAAHAAGVPILEYNRANADGAFNSSLIAYQCFPRPNIQSMLGGYEFDAKAKVAIDLKTQSSWTGQGGDQLFLQSHNLLGAVDYLTQVGFDYGLLHAVGDAARVSRNPYVKVLGHALKYRFGITEWSAEKFLGRSLKHVDFLHTDVLPASREQEFRHPWTIDADSLTAGKRFHIHLLSELLNRHRPLPGVEPVEEHHPLLSQPLIELSLRLPTYNLLRGGRQRAMARDAFADRVPNEILTREDKGDTASYPRRAPNFLHRWAGQTPPPLMP